jgi:peptidoglycan L-alanyl-D-glutamate endopeptidase CwlK
MIVREQRLSGVDAQLVKVVQRAAEMAPFDVVVLEGIRTKEHQAELVKSGASRTMQSKHLVGRAVDIAPMVDTDGDGDKEPSWHWPHYSVLAPIVKQAAQELGVEVVWGGDWRKFKDGPHWQLAD